MSVISISAPVGMRAANRNTDVVKVQVVLNHFFANGKLVGIKPLVIDGLCGSKTVEAILMFQIQHGLASEESLNAQIRPGGRTINYMNNNAGAVRYPAIDKRLDRFEDEAVWEANYDKWKKGTWLTESAKTWCRIAPAKDVEVACFREKDPDYGAIIGWKSWHPERHCVASPHHLLQIYQETPEREGFYRRKGATPEQARILAETFKAWNGALRWWILGHHYCPSGAVTRVRRDSTEELKLVLQLVSMLPGHPVTGMKPYTYKTRLEEEEAFRHAAKVAADNYGTIKSVINTWQSIKVKYFD